MADRLDEVTSKLKLNQQERLLYQRHLSNLKGPGGVTNPDGSRSTVKQMTVEKGGRTYNIPSIYDGRELSSDQATKRANQAGWNNFPSYGSEQEAQDRYDQMHKYMAEDTQGSTGYRRGGVVGWKRWGQKGYSDG